jgi:hypothetical protein
VTLGEIAEARREGLLAMEAGLATAIMGEEAAALCGGWHARDPERFASGTTVTSAVVGGQRLAIPPPVDLKPPGVGCEAHQGSPVGRSPLG